MDWPIHFPSQCPPAEADSANQTVYRFLNRRTAKDNDFESHYDRDVKKVELGRKDSPEDWGSSACQARGLSVYTDISHCRQAIDLNPSMRKKFVGELALNDSDRAKILKTPNRSNPEHHTVWVPSCDGLSERCQLVSKELLKERGASDD